MQNSASRYWLLGALALTLSAQSALARQHSDSHHAYFRHRVPQAVAQTSVAPFGFQFPFAFGAPAQASAGQSVAYDGLVAQQASASGVPASLIHRVIMRESRYNPRAVNRGNYGLMQIRLGTARSMGYAGSAEGLLDANTNMTYAVRYLAGAYRAAGGNENLAAALYARGYYGRGS